MGSDVEIIKFEVKNDMDHLIAVKKRDDILPQYLDTPVSALLEYHNLDRPFDTFLNAELLVGMCMDHRKHLHIPDNFSYIIRSGGANLRHSEFKVSYAIAVGGVRAVALIGHSNCGMENLVSRQKLFVEGLQENGGWTEERANEHFMNYAPIFEIGNAEQFILSEAVRLRRKYPKILVAPLFYRVEDNLLYQLRED